jgi:UDP-3-O-[3-hydroxymyristoyl] N-acetylglucosamine deacetylase
MTTFATSTLKTEGIGLMKGAPVQVEVEPAQPGHGIVFYMDGHSPIPARLESAVHLDRGVTLANAERKTVSIVEHFLCAAQLAGLQDLKVSVLGAPELPILDGSAQVWVDLFAKHFPVQKPQPAHELKHAVFYRHSDEICIYAIPDTHFKITYCLDLNHRDLKNQWARWDSQLDAPQLITSSRTFGHLSELPALQAAGLAKGVSMENCLGLTDDGGYTSPLRHDYEPIYHKMLDLIGDLSLSGLNPLTIKAHVFAINAGHSSHVPFAKKLLQAVKAAPAG